MGKQSRSKWRWRVEDRSLNRELNLLYEPGNWGDVLKGEWAAIAARQIARSLAPREVRYLDPFAGAPTYPLVDAARERLAGAPARWFGTLQEPHVRSGRLAATALVVLEAARSAGGGARLEVYDADPARLAAWRGVPGAEVLEASSGEEALLRAAGAAEPRDLVLVDPYDLIDRWEEILPAAIAAARRSTVLLYAHVKTPRGQGHAKRYGALRDAIRGALEAPAQALFGRIPSDAAHAKAYHEAILLSPRAVPEDLRRELREAAVVLARALAEAGAFEQEG
ncbi:MAG: hypothetical protein HY721_15205 [Planctomycetes bacterium]|nr:hypothetical protein [Planctomycetota bacterium]